MNKGQLLVILLAAIVFFMIVTTFFNVSSEGFSEWLRKKDDDFPVRPYSGIGIATRI